MKICFLGDAASIHIRRWCEYFRDNNHEVSIITFRKEEIPGIDIYFIGDSISVNSNGGNIGYLRQLFKIKKIIKKINPDVINAHYLTSYGLIGALCNVKPLIVSTWGTDILVTPKKNLLYKKLTQYVIKKCNLLTSDSSFMSEEIVRLGADENKIITVPMGIDPNKFNLKNRAEKNKTFLSMRTLCRNSNIDVILKAFKKIVEEDKEVKLILTNWGDEKENIINLIENLDLKNNVEFLGFVSQEEVIILLKNCTTYLSIPTSDSTSVTLLEAMACGIFPIVSNLPANREWVDNNINGYILNKINEKELYSLMKKTLEEIELINSAQKINRNIIKNKALWEDNMRRIELEYKKLKIH